MRKLLLFTALLFTISLNPVSAQMPAGTIVPHITVNERLNDQISGTPRQRVSRSTALVLTDQWQTIAFVSGSSTFDMNTFPQARWDFTNNKMVANPDAVIPGNGEQSYDLALDYQVTNVTGQSKLQLRFVVPSPTPFYFPFPDDGANSYIDISELNMPGTYKRRFQYITYTGTQIKAYGVQIQMRVSSYTATTNLLSGVISLLSTVLTGANRVTLNNCNLNIYGK